MSSQDIGTQKKRGRPVGRAYGPPISTRLPLDVLDGVDGYIHRQPDPKPSRPDAIRHLVEIGLAADKQARARTKSAAKDERAEDATRATADYAAKQRAIDVKTERLREQRLAKEAGDRSAAQTLLASKQDAAAMTEKTRKKLAAGKAAAPGKRSANAARAKELAGKAVDIALDKVDASDEIKTARKRALVERPAKQAKP